LLRISPPLLPPATCFKSFYFLGRKVTWPRVTVLFSFLFDDDCNEPQHSHVKISVQKLMLNCVKSWGYKNTFIVYAQNVFFKLLYTKIIQNNDFDDTNRLVWLQT